MNFNFKALFLFFVIAPVYLISCTKSDNPATPAPNPDPIPIPTGKPDTLTTGWRKVIVDATDIFPDIIFNNNSNGYLAGKKLYRSVDGGLTWKVAANKQVNSLAVFGDEKVLLINGNDSIYRTTDGGKTLDGLKTPGAKGFDAFFLNDTKGYYITNNGLYSTTDGGVSWTLLNTPGIPFINSDYSSVFFTNDNTGYILTYEGFFRMDGSISNWKKASFSGTFPYFGYTSMSVTPDNTIYVTSQWKQLYKSTDHGLTFNLVTKFPSNTIYFCDVHFVDNNVGYVNVDNRIYKTTDAGNTWNVVVALGDVILVEIHFTDAGHGWACGSKGTVLIFN